MNVREFREILEEAEGILAAAGVKDRSKQFRSFIGLIDGPDERPINEFLHDLRQRLNGLRVPAKAGKGVNEGAVNRYVERLRGSGVDRAMFDCVFSELTKDKNIRKSEADAIAHRYTGGRELAGVLGVALLADEAAPTTATAACGRRVGGCAGGTRA